jgi:hypothetical protein
MRRREDRNEERRRKKTCDQTRMPTSLATYKSLRALG